MDVKLEINASQRMHQQMTVKTYAWKFVALMKLCVLLKTLNQAATPDPNAYPQLMRMGAMLFVSQNVLMDFHLAKLLTVMAVSHQQPAFQILVPVSLFMMRTAAKLSMILTAVAKYYVPLAQIRTAVQKRGSVLRKRQIVQLDVIFPLKKSAVRVNIMTRTLVNFALKRSHTPMFRALSNVKSTVQQLVNGALKRLVQMDLMKSLDAH